MITEKLDQLLEEALFYEDLPGLAIGVSVGEDSPGSYAGLRYKGAAGYRDYMTKEALQPQHIFHVASVTKLFTGTAVMQLCEKGRLELDTPVVEILPWLYIDDKRYKSILVRHLLTHTAGINDLDGDPWNNPQTDEGSLQRYLQADEVTRSKLLWDSSENKFRYSNTGYEILGAVIAEVSGRSYEDYVASHILKPLGMINSTLLTFERTGGDLSLAALSAAGLALPHGKDEQKHIVAAEQYPYNRKYGPSSTLTTNLADLEIWAKVNLAMGKHAEGELLSQESYKKAWSEYALVPNNEEHIGLSWFIREQNGFKLCGHEGNDVGFRSSFWICPALLAHVAVLSNYTKARNKKIGKKVFDIITDAVQ